MASENKRESTIVRHNIVHNIYNNVLQELGDDAHLVPKSYIYDIICKRTGLCSKTVAFILNHTEQV